MKQRRLPKLVTSILVLGAAACAHGRNLTPQADLTGSWVLNREESDRPAAPGPNDVGRRGGDGGGIPIPTGPAGRGGTTGGVLPRPGRGAPGRIPGTIGDGRGGSGRGGAGDLPGGDRDIPRRGGGKEGARTPDDRAAAMRTALEMINRGAGRLTITYTDSTVKIVNAESETEYHADGRKTISYVADVGEVETRVRWKDGSLLIERTIEGETRIKEVFTRIDGSPKMIVATEVKGGTRDLSFSRIYEPRKD